ncbi:MAG TPA: hypothetical protein DCP98_05305 [Sphaerochaeta sp.]|nr:hypothetical protein [Sphaerochaeta sp.]
MANEKILSVYKQISDLLSIVRIDRELLKKKSESSYLTDSERSRLHDLDYRIERLERILKELEQ